MTRIAPSIVAPSSTTTITITGTDFPPAAAIFALPAPAMVTSFSVDSSTQITLTLAAPPTVSVLTLFLGPSGGGNALTLGTVIVRGAKGTFHPVDPVRVLDTRNNIGGRTTPLGEGEQITVTTTGLGDIPATNVSAIVANVTAADATTASYLTVYPTGNPFPTVSSLNFVPGTPIPNHVIVGVNPQGQINIYNAFGTVDVIVDVVGYFSTADGDIGAGYISRVSNQRVLDTRVGAPLPPGATLTFTFDSVQSLQLIGMVFNLTIDQPSDTGYITTYPSGSPRPETSSVNFTPGRAVANLVTSKLGPDGAIKFYNGSSGTVHLIIDILGAYSASPNVYSTVFIPLPFGPTRLVDTRSNPLPVGAAQTLSVDLSKLNSANIVANLTVTTPTGPGYATVWPIGAPQPPTSSLNFVEGETRANQIIPGPQIISDKKLLLYNATGTAHYIIDVFGYLSFVA